MSRKKSLPYNSRKASGRLNLHHKFGAHNFESYIPLNRNLAFSLDKLYVPAFVPVSSVPTSINLLPVKGEKSSSTYYNPDIVGYIQREYSPDADISSHVNQILSSSFPTALQTMYLAAIKEWSYHGGENALVSKLSVVKPILSRWLSVVNFSELRLYGDCGDSDSQLLDNYSELSLDDLFGTGMSRFPRDNDTLMFRYGACFLGYGDSFHIHQLRPLYCLVTRPEWFTYIRACILLGDPLPSEAFQMWWNFDDFTASKYRGLYAAFSRVIRPLLSSLGIPILKKSVEDGEWNDLIVRLTAPDSSSTKAFRDSLEVIRNTKLREVVTSFQ